MFAINKLVECISTSIFLVALTSSIQDPQCATLIAVTTACYSLIYGFLRLTTALQPERGTLSYSIVAEWRSRILSNINALLLIFGSLLCFLEWPYLPEADGWTSPERVWSHPVTFAALFLGFLHWDLCWLLWHRKEHEDTSALIHHVLFIVISHYNLTGYYFKRSFAWLSLTELSTPFLNARWFLAASGRKVGWPYLTSSLGFAITFLVTRVLGYACGLIDLWQSLYLWKSENDSYFTGRYGVILGLHFGFILNLFWSTKVVASARRAMKKAPPSSKSE